MAREDYSLVFENENLSQDFHKIVSESVAAHFRLPSVDRLFGSIHRNRLIILGAQPGAGKSTLFLEWADELAEDGHVVIFANLEMPRTELLKKSLSRISAGTLPLSSFSKIDAEGVSPALVQALEAYNARIAGNIMFLDRPVTSTDLSVFAGKVKSELGKTPVLFIDYAQIMPSSSERNFVDERSVIKETVTGLRRIANGHNCPVFAISSIRRTDYAKANAGLDALAEAQALEYGADVVAFLTVRGKGEEREANMAAPIRPVTLSVVKNRYGATGAVNLMFDTCYATFREA